MQVAQNIAYHTVTTSRDYLKHGCLAEKPKV